MLWLKTYYNVILWGILAAALFSGGWYIKSKLDQNTVMKGQISQLQADQKALQELAIKYAALDSKLTALQTERNKSFQKTDKGATDAFKTPNLTDNRLTPEQLCYWNDYGDSQVTDACLSAARVPSTPNPTPK